MKNTRVLLERINFNPQIMGGRACIRGMRITVSLGLKLLASNMTTSEILEAYPYLELEDIQACLNKESQPHTLKDKFMNIQLIESLANAIQALSPEERALLNDKLTQPSNWQSLRAKILADAQAIQQRRGGQPFEPGIDEIIAKMREERDEQLMTGLFPSEEAS